LTPVAFPNRDAFRDWLEAHHDSETEVWARLYKVATGRLSMSAEDGVREALCWGWIDAVRRSEGPESYVQRYTPRAKRSNWSKRNKRIIDELIAEDRMQPQGLAEVERAKADGRWDRAYGGRDEMEIPPDFVEALAASTELARETFAGLGRTSQFAIYYRLTTAKMPETRARRVAALIRTLEAGKAIV
jgi:uncharacterized protein YdeI (YjbR/CyaY-like superfamily)